MSVKCKTCKVKLVESKYFCDHDDSHADNLLQCPECEGWYCIDCDWKWLEIVIKPNHIKQHELSYNKKKNEKN